MSKNIIRDGYTRPGYIAAVERLHDELEFEYRPMLPSQVNKLDTSLTQTDGARDIRIIAAVLARQVQSWSEVDENDDAVAIMARITERVSRG